MKLHIFSILLRPQSSELINFLNPDSDILKANANQAMAQIYTASRFNEVWDVVQNKNFIGQTDLEKDEFAVYKSGKLPQYPVNAKSLFSLGDSALKRDAKRTVNERFDYYDRLPKKLHPNGVCVAGEWNIDQQTPYTGYFSSKVRGLFIGRISVAMEDTTSENDRGFGFAGKVFPTLNPNQVETTALDPLESYKFA